MLKRGSASEAGKGKAGKEKAGKEKAGKGKVGKEKAGKEREMRTLETVFLIIMMAGMVLIACGCEDDCENPEGVTCSWGFYDAEDPDIAAIESWTVDATVQGTSLDVYGNGEVGHDVSMDMSNGEEWVFHLRYKDLPEVMKSGDEVVLPFEVGDGVVIEYEQTNIGFNGMYGVSRSIEIRDEDDTLVLNAMDGGYSGEGEGKCGAVEDHCGKIIYPSVIAPDGTKLYAGEWTVWEEGGHRYAMIIMELWKYVEQTGCNDYPESALRYLTMRLPTED